MSSTPPDPTGEVTGAMAQRLAVAADQLREVSVPRRVEIADAVLQRALAAPRRSVLVRGRAPYDFLQVSSTAITTVVRERVDAGLEGAAVSRVLLDVDRDGTLTGLTVELLVRYGVEIVAVSDEVRLLTRETLATLLGPETTYAEPVPVAVTTGHVHVSDVTVGDPHLVDPSDE